MNTEILERISHQSDYPSLKAIYRYFAGKGIDFEKLAQEFKEEFGVEWCISYSSKELTTDLIETGLLPEKEVEVAHR